MNLFLNITAIDGEHIGVPVDAILLITELEIDSVIRIHWKYPVSNKVEWTDTISTVGQVVKSINELIAYANNSS